MLKDTTICPHCGKSFSTAVKYEITEETLTEIIDLVEDGWILYDITRGFSGGCGWIDVCLINSDDYEEQRDFYLDATH